MSEISFSSVPSRVVFCFAVLSASASIPPWICGRREHGAGEHPDGDCRRERICSQERDVGPEGLEGRTLGCRVGGIGSEAAPGRSVDDVGYGDGGGFAFVGFEERDGGLVGPGGHAAAGDRSDEDEVAREGGSGRPAAASHPCLS